MSTRLHIADRDCWCNPYILTIGGVPLIMQELGTVTMATPISATEVAVHVETEDAE